MKKSKIIVVIILVISFILGIGYLIYENWGIRMGDNRDALTSMTMYIDAITGEVLGAGVFGD